MPFQGFEGILEGFPDGFKYWLIPIRGVNIISDFKVSNTL